MRDGERRLLFRIHNESPVTAVQCLRVHCAAGREAPVCQAKWIVDHEKYSCTDRSTLVRQTQQSFMRELQFKHVTACPQGTKATRTRRSRQTAQR